MADSPNTPVTTGAAARALGIASTTLQRWAHAGLVKPALRTAGGHFRWNIEELRRQLNQLPEQDPQTPQRTEEQPSKKPAASPGEQNPSTAGLETLF